jgi:hypothetical protein
VFAVWVLTLSCLTRPPLQGLWTDVPLPMRTSRGLSRGARTLGFWGGDQWGGHRGGEGAEFFRPSREGTAAACAACRFPNTETFTSTEKKKKKLLKKKKTFFVSSAIFYKSPAQCPSLASAARLLPPHTLEPLSQFCVYINTLFINTIGHF